jgi:hypothetical protein
MEGECSLILDIVGDELEVPWLEMSAIGSSSEGSSGGGFGHNANAKAEDIGAMDPHESTQSYDFGASTITIGCILQLESLGYFAEGSMRKTGEETILESTDDEAIVFEEFFAVGLRMPPHPALIEILIKFCVQLH